jgi:hypothetical protein
MVNVQKVGSSADTLTFEQGELITRVQIEERLVDPVHNLLYCKTSLQHQIDDVRARQVLNVLDPLKQQPVLVVSVQAL